MHSCFTSSIFAARTLDFAVKFGFVFRSEAVVFGRYVSVPLSVGLLRKFEAYLGRFPFSQKFRKFWFGAKWKTFFRFARLENSQKKWNCLEGSPGSSTFSGNFPVWGTEKTFSI